MAADPYEYPTASADNRPPRISIMTIIGVLFALFMVWQVMNTIGDAAGQIERLSIEPGDEVEYHYTARLPDGRLHETTRQSVAEAAAQAHGFEVGPSFTYVAQRATVDPASPGLPWGAVADEAVANAHVGQTVTFTVPGSGWEPFTPDGPGIPREMLPQQFQRTVFLQEAAAAAAEGNTGTPGFDLADLDNRIGPLSDGHVFNAGRAFPPSWDIAFDDVNFDNRSVTFTHTVQDGQSFDVPALGGQVTVLLRDQEQTLVYRLDMQEGTVFTVAEGDELNQAGFRVGSYHVASVTDEHIVFDHHPDLDPESVGQPLQIQLEIIRKTGEDGTVSAPTDGHTDHTH